jgi:hypothetical protein
MKEIKNQMGYTFYAGPHGRVIAARIKRYKRWIAILIGVSVIEFIAVAILVSIFAKIYVAFNKW